MDQERAIDTSFSAVMQRACLFLDLFHVNKNMVVAVGRERTKAFSQYARVVRALSRATLTAIKRE